MKFTLTLFIFILLSSCKNIPKNNDRFKVFDNYITSNNLKSVDRITSFKFQGWNSLDNSHLILSSSFSKNYLVRLSQYCNDLTFSNQILIDQKQSHSLSTYFDSIIIPSNHSYKCRIKNIYAISKEQRKELNKLAKKSK